MLKTLLILVKPKNIYQKLLISSYKEARKLIISLIQEANLLVKSDDITHNTKCAERSGVPIEILSCSTMVYQDS